MAARAGHLAVEHRPADVLDMNDGSAPVAVGQLVIRDLVAACAVAIYEGVTAVAGIQVRPASQPQTLAVTEELVDAQGERPGGEIGPVDRARIHTQPVTGSEPEKAGLFVQPSGTSQRQSARPRSRICDLPTVPPPGVTALNRPGRRAAHPAS